MKRFQVLYFVLYLTAFPAVGESVTAAIPMQAKHSGTFYVDVSFEGVSSDDMMLDTGSEYMVLSEKTMKRLQSRSQVTYLNEVIGVMADGTEIKIPVYSLARLRIGCCCPVEDVKVAVFKGNTRQILGLSALRKVAPFSISVDPATLTLSNCALNPAEILSRTNPAGDEDRNYFYGHDVAPLTIPSPAE